MTFSYKKEWMATLRSEWRLHYPPSTVSTRFGLCSGSKTKALPYNASRLGWCIVSAAGPPS